MEWAALGVVIALVALFVNVVGLDRVRVFLRGQEPAPHKTNDSRIENLMLDPALKPVLVALEQAGQALSFQGEHDVGRRQSEGYALVLLPSRARVMCVRHAQEPLLLMSKPR